MAEETWLVPPIPGLLAGDEQIVAAGLSVRDFWAWTLSDLRSNTVRSRLAEYLVARALGADDRPRIEWDAHDVTTPSGARIEVKSGAYLQAWNQRRPSSVVFSGLRSRPWSPETGYAKQESYNADVYVFAVLTTTEHEAYDALDVSQWAFWALDRDTLAATGQKSIGLARVQALAGHSVGLVDLAARIAKLLDATGGSTAAGTLPE